MTEPDDTLTLARIAQIIRRFWLVIVILTLVGVGAAFAISKTQTPLYEANSSVYFSLRQSDSSSDLNQGSAYTQAQMLSFAQLATSHITLERVIHELGLHVTSDSLARNVSVTSPQNTVILDITVSSPSATRAATIANSVATNLAHVVVELAPTDSTADATVAARVIDPARTPRVQASPNKSRDTGIGGLLGLLIGIVGCILFTRLDTRVRSVETVAGLTESPVLGQIGRLQPSEDPRPLMLRASNGEDAESFRRTRAGMRFASIDKDVHVILVTSGLPAEGKTTVSVNLALAMAETNARVLLIDADLRRPRVASALAVEGAIGLTTVLVNDVSLNEARRPYASTSLDLLLSGDVPPNPSELLSSERMAQIITELSAEYDLVIVDSAPVLSVADATLLAPHVDLILLVVDASKIRKAQLAKCIRALEVTGAHISGIVLNRMKISKRRDDYYYGAIEEKSPRVGLLKKRLRPATEVADAGVLTDGSDTANVGAEDSSAEEASVEKAAIAATAVDEALFDLSDEHHDEPAAAHEEPEHQAELDEGSDDQGPADEGSAHETTAARPPALTGGSKTSSSRVATSKPRTPRATAARSRSTTAKQGNSTSE